MQKAMKRWNNVERIGCALAASNQFREFRQGGHK
jgi:hypothetical protein